MIYITRLNNKEFALNPDLIETLEATPDTVVTLTNQNKYVVKETIEEIISRIADYRRCCHPEFRGGREVNENRSK